MFDFTDIIIFILLTISILLFITAYKKTCPIEIKTMTKILYKNYPAYQNLDYQFSEKNLPSNVYNDIFTSKNVYQGGYNLDKDLVRSLPLQDDPDQPIVVPAVVPAVVPVVPEKVQ